ncbi:hypothetical protein FB451DRAFT_1400496 [Mycena latifolia]|nr:hypothetical protein FB451DRAFT_1400496 [Mycena latifolia]
MLFKAVLSVLALASATVAAPDDTAEVFVATRVYKTVTDVAPYIVTATSTFTWTQSPSTTVAQPTGSGIF